ncbi:MAG: DUF2752 domain-containing protein [Phycisphaerae bacterium]
MRSPRPAKPGAAAHPLGPVLYRVAARNNTKSRLIAGLVFLGSTFVLCLAARLHPSPVGLGTHEQLGLPPCSIIMMFGYPCPTCGMTTAFAYTVRGELVSAFAAHPGGLALALGTIVASAVSLGVLITGKVWAVNWHRVSPASVTVAAILILAGGWAFKLAWGLMSGALPVAW